MRNNGRFPAAGAMTAMGGDELFQLIDQNILHREIDFPGHHLASLYSAATMEPLVKTFLLQKGIQLLLSPRIEDVEFAGNKIKSVGLCDLHRSFLCDDGLEKGDAACLHHL